MTKKKLVSFVGQDEDDSVFAQIRDVCGEEVADQLSAVFGGERLCIPSIQIFHPEHVFAIRLGYDLASKVVEAAATWKPSGWFFVPMNTDKRIQALLEQDGLSTREVAQRTGVHMRTVWRHKQRMRAQGRRLGCPYSPRTYVHSPEEQKGIEFVRTLLLEGHSPSQIRDILNVPGTVVLTIRAELLKQGKI
ncbi:helix-turn-helix domain-containing protein [Rhizobium lemnae]|uniref:Helix-turn-helix domain-containing protein n=1 Tax=Rhizobium lemnae TaxID=1214924 RepID=A0ABV8E4W5_9HYPH|nr:helix-turn-helix domain-containing protein [Rhizobium lemnae]MCJ8506612.1 helix-turn-helix domain-containing protein [Rhizobium lemnae]